MKRVISLALLTCLCPLAASTQEAEPGGVFFTFDWGQTFIGSTDRDLETTEAEDGFESVTDLSFGAVTETRTQRLSFDLDTTFSLTEDEFADEGLVARLAYTRNSADASFDFALEGRREDIAFLRDASDFINDEGVIVLPDDFDDLTGTGFRNETTVSVGFTWGDTAPVGYSLSGSQTRLRYEDASATLLDNDSSTIALGLRLNINEVVTSNIGLSYTQSEDIGEPATETTTLSGALTFARPLGALTTGISVSRDEEDETFWAATVARDYALPNGSLRGELGVVEDEFGDIRVTGGIAFSYPLPAAEITLSADHSLDPGDDRATTTFSANYLQELSPVTSMQVGFDFGQTSDPDGGDVLATGSLSASYGYSINEFWQLNVGASFDFREDDGVRTDSTSIFLALDRQFSFRP
ncbi:hypothetical protein C7964_101333 [Loktanella sp. PT4BL]|jgi:hypothetical protein|uniref:hypothetical protein n=1 Tax=Loktanella sp. PT4BL TaxID=2135611 RepID=UPI000D755086|nr:hypothetical protein [Loktanella sp. PT4BL]PXW72224.1 hypothetical protein C7964_101333 [Loktanella sp. PT4BL]